MAHWTVARMTGASVDREDYGGRVQHPDDYSAEAHPPWTDGTSDFVLIKPLLGGYPRSVVTALAEPQVRKQLALRLVKALEPAEGRGCAISQWP